LITGDQDFKPLVDALVQMGLYVDVVGDVRHTSTELARSADSYQPLRFSDYHAWAPADWRKAHPLPEFGYGKVDVSSFEVASQHGTLGGAPVRIYLRDRDFLVYWHNAERPEYAAGRPLDRTMLAAELEFGRIAWA
jgi:glycosidase